MTRPVPFLAAILAVVLTTGAGAQEREPLAPANVVSCKPIRTAAQLQAMSRDLAASYCLEADIDLASIANFTPVGSIDTTPFTGNFFGNGHTIRNLKIDSKGGGSVGLFGFFSGGTIRDVTLTNVDIRARTVALAGGLIGETGIPLNNSIIANIGVSGVIRCPAPNSVCGGVVGVLQYRLTRSWSSADVTSATGAGGLVGSSGGAIADSFATGKVTCTLSQCLAGGLSAFTAAGGTIERSFATGQVDVADSAFAGGLVGILEGRVVQSFASGTVTAGGSSFVGGLIGDIFTQGIVSESYSIGMVFSFGSVGGGLVGIKAPGAAPPANSYWDISTSGQTASAGGTGLITAQLRAALPAGFDPLFWAINPNRSYPIPNNPDLAFNAALALVVPRFGTPEVFVPIDQHDVSQYLRRPQHASQASLATVYTMIARAVGMAQSFDDLRRAKIDRSFWHDATQRTTFSGPITEFVTLGALKSVAPAANLTAVVNLLNGRQPVILRGTFTTANGHKATHWMLATLSTKEGRQVGAIVANDPWTGTQIEISPVTRTVVSPDFPLAHFKVDGFQTAVIRIVAADASR